MNASPVQINRVKTCCRFLRIYWVTQGTDLNLWQNKLIWFERGSFNRALFCRYWVKHNQIWGTFTFGKIEKMGWYYLWLSKLKKIIFRENQSLVGLLNFECSVIIPGRAFLRHLIDLTHGIRLSHHLIRVWLSFLANYNGRSFFLEERWVNSQ